MKSVRSNTCQQNPGNTLCPPPRITQKLKKQGPLDPTERLAKYKIQRVSWLGPCPSLLIPDVDFPSVRWCDEGEGIIFRYRSVPTTISCFVLHVCATFVSNAKIAAKLCRPLSTRLSGTVFWTPHFHSKFPSSPSGKVAEKAIWWIPGIPVGNGTNSTAKSASRIQI